MPPSAFSVTGRITGAGGVTVSIVTETPAELAPTLPATSVSLTLTATAPSPWALIVPRETVTVALLATMSSASSV